jgi:hypothetical protein
MKLRLSILLLAAALAAAPAAGQTVKSLGFNTTNGQVVYSGTNPLTFTNSLQFSTNARAATRTNLGATTVGDSVFTATNEAAAATAIGLGATNNVQFESVTYGSNQINFANAELFGPWAFDEAIGFFGDQQVAAETRTNLGLGATNNVTFSNITASGTLGVTGNATLNGVNNTAPSQTADSGSSLMTRDLSDDRYSFSRWYDANDLLSGAQNVGVNPLITGNGSGHVVSATW